MSYLRYEETVPSVKRLKTKRWHVTSTLGAVLGDVHWYAHWRKYCFFPKEGSLFDAGCLMDISEFCAEQTIKHYESLDKEKASS